MRIKPLHLTISLLLLYICAFTASSCKNDNALMRDIDTLKSAPICLDFTGMEEIKAWGFGNGNGQAPKMKVVTYLDTTECTPCALSKIHLWNALLRRADRYNGQLAMHFIYCPYDTVSEVARKNIPSKYKSQTIHFDTCAVFARNNPHIPSNIMLHTFLLNDSNKVVLVGDPIRNSEIEKLMWKEIEARLGKK